MTDDNAFLKYLANLWVEHKLSGVHADYVRNAWDFISSEITGLRVPVAFITENGDMQLYWSLPEYVVSTDIGPDGDSDWFALDRVNDLSASGCLEADKAMFLKHLRHVL